MSLSDRDLAQLMLAAYEYPDALGRVTPFPWDWKDEVAHPHLGITITAGLKRPPGGEQIIIMPGTGGEATAAETRRQWLLNFSALPWRTAHPAFGWVVGGFYFDIERFYAALKPQLDPTAPIFAIGHSRGGPQAAYLAGLLKLDGINVERLVAFASPRPGGAAFAAFMADLPKLLPRTVNRDPNGTPHYDYVTAVPARIPLLEPAQELAPFDDLPVDPLPDDTWGPFALHHMQLYAAALSGVASA